MREHAPIAMVVAALHVLTALVLSTLANAGPLGYFSCAVLIFFGPCPAIEDAPEESSVGPTRPPLSVARPTDSGPPRAESLWAEPRAATEAGGRMYVPPRPVREFLESPTPDRARAYLAWNQERLRAIGRAVEALRLVTEGETAGAGESPAPGRTSAAEGCVAPAANVGGAISSTGGEDPMPGLPTAMADPRQATRGVTVLYAFASWCPYSARQTPLVAAWARSRPDVPVTGLLLDSPPGAAAELDGLPFPVHAGSPALRERLGVRSYPTLLVLKDGVPVERLAGLAPMARLEAVIRALGA
jgi:thiol-disulfide isomerase/thioredoxin